MEDLLQVGIITSTHGVRGEVKVYPTTDDPRRFRRLKEVVLDTGREKINLEIEGVKFFKQFVILKFKGLDNINDIEKYRQKSLYVTRKNAVRLQRDEYFIADLIGLKVQDEDGTELGTVKDVIETGAMPQAITLLREKGITCLAAALYQSQPLSAAKAGDPGGVCVVIGSEGQGLTDETIAACNSTVRIPMTDRVESLNAGIAGSILLWHFREESL